MLIIFDKDLFLVIDVYKLSIIILIFYVMILLLLLLFFVFFCYFFFYLFFLKFLNIFFFYNYLKVIPPIFLSMNWSNIPYSGNLLIEKCFFHILYNHILFLYIHCSSYETKMMHSAIQKKKKQQQQQIQQKQQFLLPFLRLYHDIETSPLIVWLYMSRYS